METNSSEGRLKLTPEFVLDLWLNAHYAHNNDPDKGKQLNELMANYLPSVKIQLLYSLPVLSGIIIHIGALVTELLQREVLNFPEAE